MAVKYSPNKTKAKKLEKRFLPILGVSIVVYLLHQYFYAEEVIGREPKHFLYLVLLPVVTGLSILFVYRRRQLIYVLKKEKQYGFRVILVAFWLVTGLIFSYATFGLFADIGFSYLNKKAADSSETQIFEIPVTRFSRPGRKGRSAKVEFWYQKHRESVNMDNNTYRNYENENPSNYIIEVTVQKGIWNYYVVRSWDLQKKLDVYHDQ